MAKKRPAPKPKKPAKPAGRGECAAGVGPPRKPPRKPPAPPSAPTPPPDPGDAHREREAARRRESSARTREAGPLRPVKDPARKERGRLSLRAFCEDYFPRRFRLAFAEPHLVAMERMERCTDGGGLFACAMPRAMGKTTLAEVAVLRAVLYGLRRFVVLVCATAKLATRRLKAVLRELEANDLLDDDFPEACQLVRALERIHNRTRGQTCDGKPTRIEMTAESVTLPTVAGSACSGAIIQVASMEGAIRGMNVSGPDGEPMRPDMALIDDPQTRDSAKSLIQTTDREAIVTDDVLGLAGPDVTIAAVMLCTVIYPGDLSDRFLSPEKHPEWQGVRTKMLETFPGRMDLWDRYDEVRRESFRGGDEGRRANDFYAANRAEMDAGGRVSWPERKRKGEATGLQSAMNLYYQNPRGFKAEYQNEPEVDGGGAGAKELVPAEVAKRLSGLPRREVPREAVRVVAMIDPGGPLLWYAVVAWSAEFGGAAVDYGCWPRQARTVFAHTDARPSVAELYPGRSATEALYAGLDDLSREILGRPYHREGAGEQLRVERCLVDVGWEAKTVYEFCRQSPHAAVLHPSKGIGRTATARGVSEWKPRPGELSGWHWRLTVGETGRGRMVQFDPDAWKSFLHERLTTPLGGRGCLTLWGREAEAHALASEHMAAEQSEPVTIRGATFDKWLVKPHRPDNHLLDCFVGCAVAASVQGVTWSSSGTPEPPRQRKKVDVEELYAKARGTG